MPAMPFLSTLLTLDATARLRLRAVALALFAGVVIAGSIPGARASVGVWVTGLVLHGCTYGFLTALWYLGSAGGAAARAAKAVLAIALMGAFDELVQSFLPYRSGDIRDWLIDITAALLASGVLAVCTLKAAPARLP